MGIPRTGVQRVSIVLIAAAAWAAARADKARTFEEDAVGRPPAGFSFHVMRSAAAARWFVQREVTNSFLSHAPDAGAKEGFALAVLDGESRSQISLSARIRLAAGRRSGGIVWRVQDGENYYLARLDLDRQDLGLYRVVNGNRTRVEGEDDLDLDPAAWHTLKVVQQAESMRVYLGGISVLRARDRALGKPGSVGLWCAGDADAHFDDVRLSTPDDREDHEGSRRGR